MSKSYDAYEAQKFHEICGEIWRALDDKPDAQGNPCHVILINQRDALRAENAKLREENQRLTESILALPDRIKAELDRRGL